MKKVLVLGASGMAGHVVYTYLTELNRYEMLGTTNSNTMAGVSLKLNIFDAAAVKKVIAQSRPDIIINCIGMLIKTSKELPADTIYGNAYFPHLLKTIAADIQAKLIHISTDCVFSGKTGQYTEESFKDAADIYGTSKSLGEIVDEENLTIRTSIIGPELKRHGEGLFHWYMQQTGTVNGFRSNFWSGVTTLELAAFIHWAIENPVTGLVHLTNNERISKFDLLQLFDEVFERGIAIAGERDYVCDKSFISTRNMAFSVPPYQTMLEEQKTFMLKHKDLYHHYFNGTV